MQVLTTLARKRGVVVARDELLATCWAGREVGGGSLNRCILAIRQLAQTFPGAFSIITVPRVGYRLDEAQVAAAAERPFALRLSVTRSRLTGRDAEMAALRELLSRATAGHGGLFLFAGEPGVGKTRLAEEVCNEAARRGALVLTGHCYETPGAAPYAPFAELLGQAARSAAAPMLRDALGADAVDVVRICPELRKVYDDLPSGGDAPSDPSRRYLFNAVCDVLERVAARQPLVLLLDDLHWADEATLDLLRHLTERLTGIRLLVLATHRNAEADTRGAFRDWWAEVHRQRLGQQLVLAPLSEVGGMALIAALAGSRVAPALAAGIYRATEGNAFFIEEMVRFLVEEGRLGAGEGASQTVAGFGVPEGIRLVIGKRLARLGNEAQSILIAAAVVGRPFTVELIVAMGVGSEEAVLSTTEAAEAAGILISDGGPLRFSHELIRQTLVAGLSQARRQRLNLAVARAMEQVFGTRVKDHASDVGHHLLAAGRLADPEATARYLLIAGHRARLSAAFDEALSHYEAALEVVPPGPALMRAKLLHFCGLVHRSIGPAEAVERTLGGSIGVYEQLGEPEAGVHVYASLAAHRHWRSDYQGAAEVLDRGLAAIGTRPVSGRGQLLADRACYLFLMGAFAEGDVLLTEGAALTHDEPVAMSRLAIRRSLRAWCSAEWSQSVPHAQRAYQLLFAPGGEWGRSEACAHLAIGLLTQGRWTEAQAPLAEGHDLAHRHGHFWAQFLLLLSRAWLGHTSPDPVEAFASCANELAQFTENQAFGLSFSRAQVWLGLAAWWRGRLEEAAAHFDAARTTPLPVLFTDEGWAASLLFRARTGDAKGADALLLQRPEYLEPPHKDAINTLGVWDRISATAEALVVLGRLDEAARFYPALKAYRDRGAVLRWLDGRLHIAVLANTAAAAGLSQEAETLFLAAIALADQLCHHIERADVRRDWAGVLLRRNARGDHARGLALLAEAAERYQDLGMPSHVAAARAELVSSGEVRP